MCIRDSLNSATFILQLPDKMIFLLYFMFLHFLCIFFNPQPPRDSHPIIRFTCKPVDAVVGSLNFNLPFDKYELEPSPLTQYILEKRQCNTAWQVSFYFLQLNL